MKKKLAIVLSTIMAIGVLGSVPSFATPVVAEESTPVESEFANPVYNAETDTTEYDYVYFGSYPKSEVTGAALEKLNESITDDNFADGDVDTIDGVTYTRMLQENATASKRGALRGLTYTDEAFYQWKDNKTYHYFKHEPIKWRVLQVEEDGTLLLMADNAIDCQRYSTNSEKYTWDDSPMRVWLNGYGTPAANGYTCPGEGFVNNAFTKAERADIKKTTVETPGCNLWGKTLQAAKTVEDEVFLLSVEETMNQAYGFAPDAMTLSSTRRLEPTDYAFAMGTWLGTYNEFYGSCWWMLRTSGDYLQKMALVYRTGQVYKEGYYVNTPYYGVVPALRVGGNSEYILTEEEYKELYPDKLKVVYGDVDGNGKVELADANKVLTAALGIVGCDLTGDALIAADVDGTGAIELNDANLVLQAALGIISVFPVEEPTTVKAAAVFSSAVDMTDDAVNTTDVVIEAPETPVNIWYAADSIAAQHSNNTNLAASSITLKLRDTLGWGVIFKDYFENAVYNRYEEVEGVATIIDTKFDGTATDPAVIVNNTALSSRSSKSFTTEKNYGAVIENIGKGDYLFISFGHNDEYPMVERYTDPYGESSTEGSYKWYLKTKYIEPALEAGAIPVLVSSVVKRNYIDGVYQPQFHEAYAKAMEELVAEYKEAGITIAYIDLHHKMDALYKTMTDEESKLLHAYSDVAEFADGGNEKFTEVFQAKYGVQGNLADLNNDEVYALIEEVTNAGFVDTAISGTYMDDVHFTYAGAKYATKYVLEGLKANGLGLYALADKEAVESLDTIELTDTFKEDVLYDAE